MDLNKNRYILVEELNQLINNIPKKYIELGFKKIILLIYNDGYNINDAYLKSEIKLTLRTIQRILKIYSNNNISLRDLRRSYVLSNPGKLYERTKNKTKRIPINLKLRWEILTRDNFRCVACGKSSQEELLHIDHIYPVSLGGKTTKENLRTLCQSCNFGRGNSILDLK